MSAQNPQIKNMNNIINKIYQYLIEYSNHSRF